LLFVCRNTWAAVAPITCAAAMVAATAPGPQALWCVAAS